MEEGRVERYWCWNRRRLHPRSIKSGIKYDSINTKSEGKPGQTALHPRFSGIMKQPNHDSFIRKITSSRRTTATVACSVTLSHARGTHEWVWMTQRGAPHSRGGGHETDRPLTDRKRTGGGGRPSKHPR